MAVYAVTGKLGSGKGKAAIQRLRQYLREGKRVATNCDVFLEHLMPNQSRASVIRIPDKPGVSDLYAIGSGNKFVQFDQIWSYTNSGYDFTPPAPKILPGFDEAHNGALILDECASWLNTRNFQDKARTGLLEWAIHARKYGWDVFFVCQNIKQIDAQLRESLFEYVVRLARLDRMKIPFISAGLKFITAGYSDGSMPRMHIGIVRLGSSPDGLVADRWFFRGDDLNNGYNTTQVFSDAYPHAIHSLLSSWHLSAVTGISPDFIGPIRLHGQDEVLLKTRPLPPKPPYKHMTKLMIGSLMLGMIIGAFGYHQFLPHFQKLAEPKPRHYSDTIAGKGYFRPQGGGIVVILSDGRSFSPLAFNFVKGGWEAQIADDLWIKGTAQ